MRLFNASPKRRLYEMKNIHFNSSVSTTMTAQDTSEIQFPIASLRLRSLILKRHMSTLYTQLTQEKKSRSQLDTNDPFKHNSNFPNQQNNIRAIP